MIMKSCGQWNPVVAEKISASRTVGIKPSPKSRIGWLVVLGLTAL